MHSLTMSWSNSSGLTFTPTSVSHTHGTDATFTPGTLTQNSSVYVDQSANLGPARWASIPGPRDR